MRWVKDYFSFSKKDRIGITVLLVGIGAFLYLPGLFPVKKTPAALPPEAKNAVNKPKYASAYNANDAYTPYDVSDPNRQYALFEFDPNTLSQAGWLKLGIPERTVKTILNYLGKGGKFRSAEDIRKIYNLRKEDADRIIPYIVIHHAEERKREYFHHRQQQFGNRIKISPIDINTATAEEWKSLPAIGEVLSNRIVKFREKLGGFSSVNQVAQTYGLTDSAFQTILPYLKLSVPHQNKININLALEKDLMQCQEMTTDIAKAIVIYRKQNGAFKTVEEIKKIVFINEEIFQKIAPCLAVE